MAVDFRATSDLRKTIHGNPKESMEQNKCILSGGSCGWVGGGGGGGVGGSTYFTCIVQGPIFMSIVLLALVTPVTCTPPSTPPVRF